LTGEDNKFVLADIQVGRSQRKNEKASHRREIMVSVKADEKA
jgi:hypothetical protein